jgi:hypothetical protein
VQDRRGRLLVALFLGMALLLNFPAVAVIEAIQAATGWPLVPLYVFGVWALAILAAAVIIERRRG